MKLRYIADWQIMLSSLSPKLLIVRSLAGLAILLMATALSRGAMPLFDARDIQAAVAEYPSLAVADSPLHRKFLELYKQAQTENSEELLGPSAPLRLARKAAHSLAPKLDGSCFSIDSATGTSVAIQGFSLRALTIFVPYSVEAEATPPPDFSKQQLVAWQNEHGFRINVNACFISKDEADIASPEKTRDDSPLRKFLAQLRSACTSKDVRQLDALCLPEGNKNLEQAISDPWHAKIWAASFIDNLPQRAPTKLLALIQLRKDLLVFFKLPDGKTAIERIVKHGDRYFLPGHQPEEYGLDCEYLLLHLSKFLDHPDRTPEDLIVKE